MSDRTKYLSASLLFLAAGGVFGWNDWLIGTGICVWVSMVCLVASGVGDEPEARV